MHFMYLNYSRVLSGVKTGIKMLLPSYSLFTEHFIQYSVHNMLKALTEIDLILFSSVVDCMCKVS